MAARNGDTTMNTRRFRILVPGVLAATALALTVSARAQTPAPGATPPATSPAAPMTGHHMGSHAKTAHHADLGKECQAMAARKQEMQDKVQAMDASLDKLVAQMNAAAGSKEVDALEKPMAAVLNELVSQRKALRSMMMEMQPQMMAHMAHHMQMHGAKGAMDCPMMKTGTPPAAEEKKTGM
jgi:hypothetical protein